MTGNRLISALLFICFSIYLGHSLVPHHHHEEVVFMHGENSCPSGHEDQHEPGEHPFHCHAFNSLEFFKYDRTQHQAPVKVLSVLFIPVTKIETEIPVGHEFQQIICLKIPVSSNEWPGSISLRAPPKMG